MKHHGLVPEQRTDRRGMTQIRWVKPPAATGAGRVMPAPSVGPRDYSAADDTPRMAELFSALVSTRQFASSRDRALANVHFLDEMAPDLVDRIKAVCERDGDRHVGEGAKWRHLLGTVDYQSAEVRTPGITRTGIERALAVFPLAESLSAKAEVAEYMEHAYDVVTILTAESGHREVPADTSRAMFLVAHLHGVRPNMSGAQADLPGLYAAAREDIDFIAARWAEVERIIPELDARGTHDRVLIRSMLDHSAPAVASGLL